MGNQGRGPNASTVGLLPHVSLQTSIIFGVLLHSLSRKELVFATLSAAGQKRCWNQLGEIMQAYPWKRHNPIGHHPTLPPMRTAVLLFALGATVSLSTGVLAGSKKSDKSGHGSDHGKRGAKCGPANGNLQCEPTHCCSAAGVCGEGAAWCGVGCQIGMAQTMRACTLRTPVPKAWLSTQRGVCDVEDGGDVLSANTLRHYG